MRVEKLVIHCAATPADMDIGVVEIDRWHKERGWTMIGYHYVIRRNGVIERGRDEGMMGAHVRGHNHYTLGICLVGGKPGFNFTAAQMDALKKLVFDLRSRYPGAGVCGHKDLDPGKECPTFDVAEVLGYA